MPLEHTLPIRIFHFVLTQVHVGSAGRVVLRHRHRRTSSLMNPYVFIRSAYYSILSLMLKPHVLHLHTLVLRGQMRYMTILGRPPGAGATRPDLVDEIVKVDVTLSQQSRRRDI